MNFYVLASLILIIVIISRAISRQKKIKDRAEQTFWERERMANSVRRKSLDDLAYIQIPLDRFPINLLDQDPRVRECVELLKTLSTQPIVNLTGYSNTDLKLEYGAPNITLLSEYDQNYTVMVRTLQKWADLLWEAGFRAEAVTIMEFAVSTHTDTSHTYYRLAEFYSSYGENEKIQSLIQTAETLRSANKSAIVRTLQESYL